MGLESPCQIRLGRATLPGKAHVDGVRFTFRGETRLAVALTDIRSARVSGPDELRVTHAGGDFTLLLEPGTAPKWADKLLHPPSRADKLGLKPAQRVAVIGVDDEDFLREAALRLGAAPTKEIGRDLDLIFYAADTPDDLTRLEKLKAHLRPAGAIWVVSRKGKAATLKDVEVMQAARAAGLVDNKVCSFSATHTALRLVIPRGAR